MTNIQLIVGLANPGKEYENTRHNAGAWFVQSLADYANINLKPTTKFQGLHGQANLHGQQCHLIIPTTYMNHSGQAVKALANYYKVSPENILIAHDDIDLPVGTVRLKLDGGDGGHNGLRDIVRHLGTKKFHRLRIGVGRPARGGGGGDVVDYVLKNPSKADRQKIDDALARADQVLPLLVDGEIEKAMQQLHTEMI